MDDELRRVAGALAAADTAVAFTGAGVSTASGVPSFRGEDGIWRTEFDPDDFRVGRFEADPSGFWRDRLRLHEAMFPGEVEPNAAHEALARLEDEGHLDAVVTQNTDGLHAAAGSERVLELHGSNARVVCRGCGSREDAEPIRERVRDGELPPRCECGGVYKPDVVLFGEMLPEGVLAEARRLAADSDVFLAVGSSLTVEPAASLPRLAAADGTLVLVNLEETPCSDRADFEFRADATEVLPALSAELRG
ncbi:SIR2 family NAD-dependent protein deacylase [Halegenticoccus soli]|uniref:SIR2 family NAD-dependent protein deacylase n=1 Tax=Halegenticoccus soli TaxID=1985678 RepID=UPI000C6D3BF7|nr:Sir2 family NAD-dependent protein deacetylase [Halegenticoccus soli]